MQRVVNSLQLVPRSWFLDLHFRVGLVKGVLPDGIGSLVHQCVHHLECACLCVDVLRSPGDIYTIVLTKIGLSPPHLLQHRWPIAGVQCSYVGDVSTKGTVDTATLITHQHPVVDGRPLGIWGEG